MTLKLPKKLTAERGPSHRRAKVMEKETATRIGGRQTVGSGNKDEKGDVRLKYVARIECKTTVKRRFTITTEMIDKIEEATTGTDEIPAVQIELMNGLFVRYNLLVIPDWALDILLERKK
jgi:hypothetical protein